MLGRFGATLACVAAVGALAHAGPNVVLDLKPPPARGDAPLIRLTVRGAPAGTDPSRWTLAAVDGSHRVDVHPIAQRAFADTDKALAVVVVFEGHMIFVGNTDYEPDPDSQYPGVFRELLTVPEAFRAIAPPRSLGAIVRYDKGATDVVAMGPLAVLDAGAFGTEADYQGRVTRDLVAGVERGVELLRKAVADRRVLLVIGDGADTNIDTAKARLAQARKLCDQDRIEVYAIAFIANIGDELTAIKALVPDVLVAATPPEVATHVAAIAREIGSTVELDVSGRDFTWDGDEHEVQLRLDGQPWPSADTTELIPGFPPKPDRPRHGEDRTWLVVAGALAAAIVVVSVLLLRGRS